MLRMLSKNVMDQAFWTTKLKWNGLGEERTNVEEMVVEEIEEGEVLKDVLIVERLDILLEIAVLVEVIQEDPEVLIAAILVIVKDLEIVLLEGKMITMIVEERVAEKEMIMMTVEKEKAHLVIVIDQENVLLVIDPQEMPILLILNLVPIKISKYLSILYDDLKLFIKYFKSNTKRKSF
jgi:hypothetical protein